MRSSPWVVPRPEPMLGFKQWQKWTPRLFPWGPGRIYRTLLFCLAEIKFFLIFTGRDSAVRFGKKQEAALVKHMKKVVPEKYHEILTPEYGVGWKRRIFDVFWLDSLNDPKIDLTTPSIMSLQPRESRLVRDECIQILTMRAARRQSMRSTFGLMPSFSPTASNCQHGYHASRSSAKEVQ